jgi:hypothetical protein
MIASGRLAVATIVAAAGLLQGCASTPNVRSDYDRAADFGSYHTFNFVPQPGTDKMGYSTLTTQELEAAVTNQMQKRGYTLSEHPDLLIDFSARLQGKQRVESSPTPYYGYRAGLYAPWAGYSNAVYTVNYTEGTLNVDLVDAARRKMVWEGVTIGELTKEKLHNREAAIDQAVADVFSKYPFRAGESQPVSANTGP